MPDESAQDTTKKPIVLYDGTCKFCVQAKTIAHARTGSVYRYVSMSDTEGKALLQKHGLDAERSSYLITNQAVQERSQAALSIMKTMGGVWRLLARLGAYVPVRIRDALYDLVARHRR